MSVRICPWPALLLFLFTLSLSAGDDDGEFFPLDQVQPGMAGEWRTVVSGTEIRTFPLEVIGVAWDFIAPGRSLILCKAVDEENLLSGPVAGMSGSPVYLDGKLAGAYAYGFTWPKAQAIIGVTPIADMLELYALPTSSGGKSAREAGAPRSGRPPAPRAGASWRDLSTGALASHLQPLPTPLGVSGFSPRVLADFADHFKELGLEPVSQPMGRAGTELDVELRPGSAVAGVLLDGDFSIAGTGTVTHRDGDRLLAFGHPFFGMGPGEIPMAAAEILTVVRALPGSFKLSNTGPVIGTIYEDRLSAIAGEIGREPPVTRLSFQVTDASGGRHTYEGNLFRHPRISPLISGMALSQVLNNTMEAVAEQTFYLESHWEVEGHEPIVRRDAASGAGAGMILALQHMGLHQRLINNPFEAVEIASVTYEIRLRDEWAMTRLESVRADRLTVKAGQEIGLTVTTVDYRGARETRRVRVPVPERAKPGEVMVVVGDAGSVRRFDVDTRATPADLEQLMNTLRKHRSRGAIYVKLVKPSPGLSVEGQSLPNLLPSAAALLQSPGTRELRGDIRETGVWETSLPVEGEFSGQQTLRIEIE